MTTSAVRVREQHGRVDWPTVAAFGWAATNAALLVALLWLDSISRGDWLVVANVGETVISTVAVSVGTAVGASIAARFPRHPVGWLVLSALTLYVLNGVLDLYGQLAVLNHPGWSGGRAAAAVDQSLWLLVFGAVAMLLLIFPSGRPPVGHRWRLVYRGVIVAFPLAFFWGLIAHPYLDRPLTRVANPFAISALDAPAARLVNFLLILGCLGLVIACAASVAIRYRRAEPAQRAQLKWMVVAGTALPITVLVCVLVGLISPQVGDAAGSIGFSVTLAAVPLAMAFAMTRYKLYSVDRFVDTALVYLSLTALVTALYGLIVLGSSRVTASGSHRSPVAVAGATLLVAAIFSPLRARLHLFVARRFHRRRYDAVRVVDDFVRRLRDEQASLSELEPTLARALGDPSLKLCLWHTDTATFVGTDGMPLPVEAPGRSVFRVMRDGAPVAAVVHDPALGDEPLLLDAVARAAALPLDNSRMHLEVLSRLDEVQASRHRIVMAVYEERRRLERDLHDGAQQRLVSLALSLQLARERLHGESADILDEAAAELSAAVREVRELARGIHPATLTEEGLAAALESLADRTPLDVLVDATDEALADDVAAAAYFTACEAVANVVKHADATHVTIRSAATDGDLVISVTDDGAGGASLRAGGGLRGLADRIDALGGRLTVTSSRSAGTTVKAELPCGQ